MRFDEAATSSKHHQSLLACKQNGVHWQDNNRKEKERKRVEGAEGAEYRVERTEKRVEGRKNRAENRDYRVESTG